MATGKKCIGLADAVIKCIQYQVRTILWHNRWRVAVPHGANRMKRSNLPKEDETQLCFGVWKHTLFWGVKTHSVLGCTRERICLRCRQVTSKVPKPWKISLSYSFAVEMAHFDRVRWKYDSVCILSMLRGTLELILWKKADKKCKDQKRRIFFAKGVLIWKNIFQTQRKNAVRGKCSRSGVLYHIPSNFTLGVRRRMVLQFWALSGRIDLLPRLNIQGKWADRLGQMHCRTR